MEKKFIILFWGSLALVTGIILTVYIVTQQVYRQSANDPQIQLAVDTANLLNSGKAPREINLPPQIDLANSLSPFIIIYDQAGQPLAASASLNNQTPVIPQGVLDYARQHGEDRLTWQPATGVRNATVVKSYNNGFVLAGRSLTEIEKRENQLNNLIGLAWLGSVALLLGLWFLLKPKPAG